MLNSFCILSEEGGKMWAMMVERDREEDVVKERCRGRKCERRWQTCRLTKGWCKLMGHLEERKREMRRERWGGWRTFMSTSCCASISAAAVSADCGWWENCKGAWGGSPEPVTPTERDTPHSRSLTERKKESATERNAIQTEAGRDLHR